MNPTMAECVKDISLLATRFLYRALIQSDFPQPHHVEDFCDDIRAYVQRIEARKDIARD